MKKSNNLTVKGISFALFWGLVILTVTVHSQSKIQEVSLRAPENIRIDGKTLEWPNNKLNAYNDVDRIFYSISNDDDNLYLTVRGPYFFAPEKIIMGGLTFTISNSLDKKARKNAKNNIAVTFPIVPFETGKSLISAIGEYQKIMQDTTHNQKEHNELVERVNSKTIDAMKEIKIIGIKEIEDSLISVYNTTGMKAMGTFNRGMALTLEIAIPLKYLGIVTKNETKFSYNIKLNVGMPALNTVMGDGTVTLQAAKAMNNADYLYNPTDFWGEYTLAKNP